MNVIRTFYIMASVHFNHIFQGYLADIRGVHISRDCHCTNEASMKYRGKYMICINWDAKQVPVLFKYTTGNTIAIQCFKSFSVPCCVEVLVQLEKIISLEQRCYVTILLNLSEIDVMFMQSDYPNKAKSVNPNPTLCMGSTSSQTKSM